MNLNDVKNAYGRQTATGNNSNSNKSDGSGLVLLLIVGVGAYLCYRYMLKENKTIIKIKKHED